MPAKPNAKNWTDLKLVITVASVAATLSLWNLLAANTRPPKTNQEASFESQMQSTNLGVTRAIQGIQAPAFMGKILLGGQAPQVPVVVVNAPAQSSPAKRHQRRPTTSTRSS